MIAVATTPLAESNANEIGHVNPVVTIGAATLSPCAKGAGADSSSFSTAPRTLDPIPELNHLPETPNNLLTFSQTTNFGTGPPMPTEITDEFDLLGGITVTPRQDEDEREEIVGGEEETAAVA